MIRIIVNITIILCLASCQKKNYEISEINGVIVTTNNNMTVIDSAIKLKLMTVLEPDSLSYNLLSNVFIPNNKPYFYILDDSKCIIYRYDMNGQLLNTIGRKGNGPGEFVFSSDFFEYADTFYVSLYKQKRQILYKPDGTYLHDIRYQQSQLMPLRPISLGKTLVSQNDYREILSKSKQYYIKELICFDTKFNLLAKSGIMQKECYEDNVSINPDDALFNYVLSDSVLYYGRNSDNIYRIDIYNEKFKLIRKISKNYSKKMVSNDEIAWLKKISIEDGVNYSRMYKKSIYSLNIDKDGFLWVCTPSDNKNNNEFKYDIFNKEGVLVKSFNIPELKGRELVLANGLLFAIDYQNTSSINIYEYFY